MKVNQLLRREREIRGWSQAKVASEVGTDPATVGRWERGLSFPYPYFREKLCILFGKNARELGLLQDDESNVIEEMSPAATNVDQHTIFARPLYDPAIPLASTLNSGLVGRDALLQQLKQRLGDSAALTALSGLPGVGKTALAAQLVHDEALLSHFRDGVLWVGLGPYPHVQGNLSRWGTLLGAASSELVNKGNEVQSEAIRSAIGMRRLLLVIDDAWTVEDALAFKIGGPECAYLVTTRFPQIALYFAGVGAIAVHELNEDDSVALLQRLVPAVVAHDANAIYQLVRSVGGLPLALTLIGKYLFVQSHSQQPRRIKVAMERLRDIRERLQLSEPYALVERHSSLQPDTPLSLKSVIAVSEQMLNEQARIALHALAVFPAKPNSFSEEAAAAVCGQPLEILDELSDAGILESRGPGRYTLHRTIADYALTCLVGDTPYKRLVAYFVAYVEMHKDNYGALEQENVNILAALHAASEHTIAADFVHSVHAFMPFMLMRGLYTLADELLQKGQQAAEELDDFFGVTQSLQYRGEIAQRQSNYAQAEKYLQEGLSLAQQAGYREMQCMFLDRLGALASNLKDYAQSELYLVDGLALARQLDHKELICNLLLHLGKLATEQEICAVADVYLQEGLQLAHQIEKYQCICDNLYVRGELSLKRHLPDDAERIFRNMLLHVPEGNQRLTARAFYGLSRVAAERGNRLEARRWGEDALSFSQTSSRCLVTEVSEWLETLSLEEESSA